MDAEIILILISVSIFCFSLLILIFISESGDVLKIYNTGILASFGVIYLFYNSSYILAILYFELLLLLCSIFFIDEWEIIKKIVFVTSVIQGTLLVAMIENQIFEPYRWFVIAITIIMLIFIIGINMNFYQRKQG